MASYTIADDSVPPGPYKARFLGTKPVQNQYGPGVKFGFVIIDGDHKDAVVTRISDGRPTVQNATGRLLAALSGQKPKSGMSIDPEDYRNDEYEIEVAQAKGGGVRVEEIRPVR